MIRCLLPIILLMLSGCQESELITIHVGEVSADVELAATGERRRQGLMHRKSLDRDRGMLMVFPQAKQQKMWMLNMQIPLDVGFFDDDGVLLNIVTMEPDGGKTIHRSIAPALYALEMNRGWYARNGIEPGVGLYLPRVIEGR
ncbi:MAG: DUF192 domain-containing protein [Candidatus Sedimenticola sp. (ex Thyasira tokunagai)]